MTDLDLYQAYPRHVAKFAALKAIAKAVRTLSVTQGEAAARETIYQAVRSFAASPAGNRGQFTPHPSTWFNQGRYMDDPAEWFVGLSDAWMSQGGSDMPLEEIDRMRAKLGIKDLIQ